MQIQPARDQCFPQPLLRFPDKMFKSFNTKLNVSVLKCLRCTIRKLINLEYLKYGEELLKWGP